jgi:ATP-dependent exoDNAse (exonuclease V) alpha subunit
MEQVRSSVKIGAEKSGAQIRFLAPTGTSRENLKKDGLDAITLQMFLVNDDVRPASGSVLVLDEAGLVSVPQMHALFTLAEENDYRVILVGDSKQHVAVERGDALRLLESEMDEAGEPLMARASILRIRRQRDPMLLAAIQAFRDSRLIEGFNQIASAGWVEEIADFEKVTQAAADHYVSLQVENSRLPNHKRKTVLACAPTHRENDSFNRKVRAGLIKKGLLKDPETSVEAYQPISRFSEQDRRSPVHVSALAPGTVLQIDRDIRALELKKGDAVRLTGLGRAGAATFLRAQRNGENIRLAVGELTKAFKSWTPAVSQSMKLRPGDRLLLRANGQGLRHKKKCPLVNGELVEVRACTSAGIELADGRMVPKTFRNFRYAYGVTSHMGQSQTVGHSIMLVTDQGMPNANSKQFLVSSSRGKESLRIFTSSASELRNACQQAGDRALATDLLRNGGRRQSATQAMSKEFAAGGHTPGIFAQSVPAVRVPGILPRSPITGVVIARLKNLSPEEGTENSPEIKKDDMPM